MTNFKKLKVLAIDDELTQRMLVKEYLEDAGHDVAISEDGKRGLKIAISTRPDIILLDYLLPLVDGNSICKTLKSNPATADIPVILVTGAREADVIENGLSAGADDFITKPVDWTFLADRVANVVRQSQEKRELRRALATRGSEPKAEAPAAAGGEALDARLEQLMHDADLRIEQAHEAARADRERLESEHAESIKKAIAETRAEVEREMQGAIEGLRASLAHDFNEQLRKRSKLSDQDWANKIADIEQQSAIAVQYAEQHAHESWTLAMTALKSTHAQELRDLRERTERDVSELKASAQSAIAAAEQHFNTQLSNLRSDLAAAEAQADSRTMVEAARTNAEQSLQAAWSLSYKAALAQSSLASALIAKVQSAQQQPNADVIFEIDRSARALGSLTTNFRLLAHSMLATTEPVVQSVQLATLVADITEQAERISADRRILVRTAYIDPSVTIFADQSRLRYAILCLVINAIRFTPAGGTVSLSVTAHGDGGVEIVVADTGVGISPAKLDQLRTCLASPHHVSLANATDGAGLGIPLVQAMVRKLSGSLDLESRLGHGTRAKLYFPSRQHDRQAQHVSMAS